MNKWVWGILLCFVCGVTFAQKEGNVWAFGSGAGFDFNSGSPVSISTAMQSLEGNATICDKDGQLLFYTEGSIVWDREGHIMPNASNLTGLSIGINNFTSTVSCTQGTVIVPMPDSAGKYYVFSLSQFEQGINLGRLYYSVVDMGLNNGLGDVISSRRGILIDSVLTEKMTAVMGDRCNVWLLVRSQGTAVYKAFEITSAGINFTPVTSNVAVFDTRRYLVGEIQVSPDRRKIISCNQSLGSGLELCDFNPATGVVSNPVKIDEGQYYSACFSPDNTKLYALGGSALFQWDISFGNASAIAASKTSVSVYTGFNCLKLGPDNKIYISKVQGSNSMVINQPNNSGVACDASFTGPVLSFGRFNTGLPNAVAMVIKDTTLPTTQYVTVCFKDSIILYANDSGWNYQWDDGTIESHRMVNASGTYIVHYYTAPCTYHTDTFIVDFASYAPATGVYSGCSGGKYAFLWVLPDVRDTGSYTITWSDALGNVLKRKNTTHGDTLNNILPGNYFVNIRSGNGCDTIIQLKLPSAPDTIYTSFVADTLLCYGKPAHFVNTSAGAISYTWYLGDGDTSLQDTIAHIYDKPGVFNVQLVSYPCHDTAKRTVIVDSTPYVRFFMDSIPVCIGRANNFYPIYQSNAVSLAWDFGDGATVVGDWRPTHGYSTHGNMEVTLTAKFRACADTSFKDTIAVNDYPIVDIGPDTSICKGQAAIFLSNLAAGSSGDSYLWSTGATTAAIAVTSPGLYFLQVSKESGCATTDSVLVNYGCYIAIPNAFTPNGDGINDYFFPKELLSRGVQTFHMQIFNHWGQPVYETSNTLGRGWDGAINGVLQKEGVYVYLIEVSFANEAQERYKGNVTLMR